MIRVLRAAYRNWVRLSPSLRFALFFFFAAAVVAVLEVLGVITYPAREIRIFSPKPGVVSSLTRV